MKAENEDKGNRSDSYSRDGERAKSRGQSGKDGLAKSHGRSRQNGHAKPHSQSGKDGYAKPHGQSGQNGHAKSRGQSEQNGHAKPYGQSGKDGRAKPYGQSGQDMRAKLNGHVEYDEPIEFEVVDEPIPESKLYQLASDKSEKLLSLLGFAARARRLVFGAELCRNAVRAGQISLVIVAADASPNTKKRIIDACKYYGCDVCQSEVTASILSSRLGKTGMTAVVGLGDSNFIRGITALCGK